MVMERYELHGRKGQPAQHLRNDRQSPLLSMQANTHGLGENPDKNPAECRVSAVRGRVHTNGRSPGMSGSATL